MLTLIERLTAVLPLVLIALAFVQLRDDDALATGRVIQTLLAAAGAALFAALVAGADAALTQLAVACGALLAALSFAMGPSPVPSGIAEPARPRAMLVLLGVVALLALAPADLPSGLLWVSWLVLAAWATHRRHRAELRTLAVPAIGAASVIAGATADGLVGPWLMLIGAAATLPLVPFHGWYLSLFAEGRTSHRAFVAALLPMMALILLLDLPAAARDAIGPVLATWGAASLGYAALRAFGQSELRRVLAFAAMASAALVALGVGNAGAAAAGGAALQALSLAVGSGGMVLLCGRLASPSFGLPLRGLGGLAEVAPRLAFALVLLTLTLMQTPALGGFAAWWLVLMGSENAVSVAALALLLLLGASVVARLLREVVYGPPGSLTARQQDLAPRELALLGVLVGVDLVLGLAPGMVLGGAGLFPN